MGELTGWQRLRIWINRMRYRPFITRKKLVKEALPHVQLAYGLLLQVSTKNNYVDNALTHLENAMLTLGEFE